MEKILIADDQEMVRNVLQMTLGQHGYDVDTAVDGAEALRLFNETRYDLVIIDILMPEKDGFETVMEMRSLSPKVPLIAMSGGGARKTNYDYLDIARRLGAQQILRKPFKPDQLMEQVRIALASEAIELC